MLLFSFSIFNDCQLLKIENENNSMKTQMQKFDNRSLIYGTIGTYKQVLIRQGKQDIMVQAAEVPLNYETKVASNSTL